MGVWLADLFLFPHFPFSCLVTACVCLMLSTSCWCPVVHYSMRGSVNATFFPKAAPLGESRVRCAALTGCLLLAVLVGALVVPNIQFAFQLTGSLSSDTLAFTLPGLIALR